MKKQNKFAIIIGGSGSLGQAVVKKFASMEYNILMTGRNFEKLKIVSSDIQLQYPNIIIKYIYFDFNDDSSFSPFLREIENIKTNISVLINTGSGFYKGDFANMTLDQINNLIKSNFTGIVSIFHELIKIIIGKNRVDLINITSYSSATNLDTSKSSSLHIATKAALQVFDTTLSNELLNTNIRLTTIAPSTFAKNGRIGLPLLDIAELIWLIHIIPSSIKIDTIIASYTGN